MAEENSDTITCKYTNGMYCINFYGIKYESHHFTMIWGLSLLIILAFMASTLAALIISSILMFDIV